MKPLKRFRSWRWRNTRLKPGVNEKHTAERKGNQGKKADLIEREKRSPSS
jgi:hypothetical protein